MDRELGQLASGEYVFDRPHSHLHGAVEALISDLFARISSFDREFIVEEIDLGKVVGQKHCVETGPDDEIVYAQRPNRKGPTRFVLGRQPADCSSVTLVLKRDEYAGVYVVLTAYIGTRSEPEPWDRYATPKSESFWESHAMIWNQSLVVIADSP